MGVINFKRFCNKSLRQKNWDYSLEGMYFITICTFAKQLFFGEVKEGISTYNEEGVMCEKILLLIPSQFRVISIESYVVMPNHIHVIFKNNYWADRNPFQISENAGGVTGRHNPTFYNNLSRVVRWFKGRVTFEIRKFNPCFRWQPKFYDRIINDENDRINTVNYILENPKEWQKIYGYNDDKKL